MIYTVTLNPSLDHIMEVQDFKTGKTNRAKTEEFLAGGKGINVSTVLKNLGAPNVALGILAGYTGQRIRAILSESGLNADFLYCEDGLSRVNVKMKEVDEAGVIFQETEINAPGPTLSKTDTDAFLKRLLLIEDQSVLVLSGSIPKTQDGLSYENICKALGQKKLKIVVDATKETLLSTLKYHPFLVKPNLAELEELFQTTIQDKNEVKAYAQKLIDLGAENVIVSMGKDGGVFLSKDGAYDELEAPKGTLVNSVGAGDSLVAGFLAYVISHQNEGNVLQKAFRYGICTASASAFSKELAKKEDVDHLFHRLA